MDTATAVPTRNGPDLWDLMVDAVGVPGAVVGGGCIRDYLLGFEPKDIDIFVPVPTREGLEELCDRLNDSSLWQLGLIEHGDEGEYDQAFEGILIGVIEGEFCGLPVNLISRRPQLGCGYDEPTCLNDDDGDYIHYDGPDNWSLVNSFDFGILQWTFESKAVGIVCTTAALTDLANRTATLTCEDYYEQSLDRYARYNARHPGALRLVDPFALEMF